MTEISDFESLVNTVGSYVWGLPMLIILVGTGFYLTFTLRGLQFTKLYYALWLALIKRKEEGAGDISHFQALMTALSATVGTGNIAGVATAIAAGGPGALFWMWMTGLVGMATKYAEAVLAVKYRVTDGAGEMCGGPMYYISRGLGLKWLGSLFAVFAAVAAFGIGNMVQSNSVAEALNSTFNLPHWITGVALLALSFMVIIGGIKSIGRITSVLVPVMIVAYMGGCLFIILSNLQAVPDAIAFIVKEAFTPTAATGGFAGATVMMAIRYGVARGVFSNESGLGSSPIAAAAAQTSHPVVQALVSMTQTFIDTIIVCTMTGLVIVMTGAWTSGSTGATLSNAAFSLGMPGGNYVVTISLVLFAYSTILGWCYYGEKSIEYLFGIAAIKPYRYAYLAFILVGAVAHLDLVWAIADVFNGLMAVPNLVGLLLLSPVVVQETRGYFASRDLQAVPDAQTEVVR